MRLFLAIQCFFALLFGGKLPPKALPAPEESEEKRLEREALSKELETAKASAKTLEEQVEELKAAKEAAANAKNPELDTAKAELQTAKTELGTVKKELEGQKEKVDALKEAQAEAAGKLKEARDHGALALVAWLQREGRLIDFLKENIDEYEDEQVGAAVRSIHKGCLKVLDEGLTLEAILEGEDESPVTLEAGFDPVAIQLTGNVKGDPPFKGTLMHHGWRASSVSVPVPETVDPHVLAPAEVEL